MFVMFVRIEHKALYSVNTTAMMNGLPADVIAIILTFCESLGDFAAVTSVDRFVASIGRRPEVVAGVIERTRAADERLYVAATCGRAEVVSILLNGYAYSLEQRNDLLYHAAFNGDYHVAKMVLHTSGIRADCHDGRILGAAARSGNPDVVRLLLEMPDHAPAANDGFALLYAARRGNAEIVDMLLDWPTNAADALDGLVLVAAAKNGHTDIIRRLRRRGAKVCSKAIEYAFRMGHFETVLCLCDTL